MTLARGGTDAALDPLQHLSIRISGRSKIPSPLCFAATMFMRTALLIGLAIALVPATALAQQPFAIDDADVTDKGKFHLQISNEFDILQRAAYPTLRQNTDRKSVV